VLFAFDGTSIYLENAFELQCTAFVHALSELPTRQAPIDMVPESVLIAHFYKDQENINAGYTFVRSTFREPNTSSRFDATDVTQRQQAIVLGRG